jgi:CheY-like chemotaxis protein
MARVLVAEDESILRGLIVSHVTGVGHQVFGAADGMQAWVAMDSGEFIPDIVLLDLMMPLMTGYELLQKMRADQRFAMVPVVVLSNSGQIDDLNRAYACGATDVLIKANFNPEQLAYLAEKYLKLGHKTAQVDK